MSRWVPAQDRGQMLDLAMDLNARGVIPSLNYLGEKTADVKTVKANIEEYIRLAQEGCERRVRFALSVKPSQLGVLVSSTLLRQNVTTIVEVIRGTGVWLFLDAEGEITNENSWQSLRELIRAEPQIVPTVQVSSAKERRRLPEILSLGRRVRLCKGAYQTAAFRVEDLKGVVNEMLKLAPASNFVLATNSPSIVRLVSAGSQGGFPEIETLQGNHKRAEEAAKLSGLGVRRYIPYGDGWLQYCRRRDAWFRKNVVSIRNGTFR